MRYYNYTKNNLISILFIFPFFLMYEVLAFFLFDSSDYIIRNSADIVLRDFLSILTQNTFLSYNNILLIFIFLYIVYNFNKNIYRFKISYIFFMFLEGILFGFILVIILNGFSFLNYNYSYFLYDYTFMFYSCLGAGIWEEILFRLILLNILLFGAKKILNYNASLIISVLLSSFLFSLFHYIGSSGDVFMLYTFIVRFAGGIFLSILYLYRGLGISMISHIIYDFILVTIPVF